jgi:hypothetical protein
MKIPIGKSIKNLIIPVLIPNLGIKYPYWVSLPKAGKRYRTQRYFMPLDLLDAARRYK